jgi:predicted TIM-barrel fold metal-dependent hydrolase
LAQHGVDHAVVLTSYKVDLDRPSVQEILEILTNDRARQLLYGSDWPLVRMQPDLTFQGSLEPSDEDPENIAWRKADRLFRIDVSALGQAPAGDAST